MSFKIHKLFNFAMLILWFSNLFAIGNDITKNLISSTGWPSAVGGSQVQVLLYILGAPPVHHPCGSISLCRVYILVAPPIHHSAALSDPNPFVWTLVSRQIPALPRASPTYDCKYTDRGMCKYCIHPTPHIEPSCVNIVEQDLYCGVCVNIGNVSKSAAISDALGGPNSQLPKWRTAQIQVHVGISQKYISCTLISVLSNCHSWN